MLATDADNEGNVIAWDVATLIADICPEPFRVKLTSLDEASVGEAIRNASAVSKEEAVPGRTRAIIDRMIGATFSNKHVTVGRIQTALLGIVSAEQLPVAKLRLCAPAADGGRPWVAECDVKSPISEKIAHQLVKVEFPVLDKKRASKPFTQKPKHMGEILVRAGDEMNLAPGEAAEAMQSLYEAGRLSYPRAKSQGLSTAAIEKIAKLVKNSGYHFEKEKVAAKKDDDVHDAPYPIGNVNVANNPGSVGDVEGLRTLVARDLVKSGQSHIIEEAFGTAAKDHLIKLGYSVDIASFVGALPWRREVGPRYPGQNAWSESEVVFRREDTVLLEAAVKRGLGQPSTWSRHIDKFVERKLIDENMSLTAKGKSWVANSPPALLDPRVSIAIENACEQVQPEMMHDLEREPWEMLAERIVTALPVAIREPLVSGIATEKVHPKTDPTAMFRKTVGLDEVLEKSKELTLSYGPKRSIFDD